MPIWEEIDGNHDVIIEASAGTGKTYTLQHIVDHLVTQGNCKASEILLVTYTDKAAGELHDRIRTQLAKLPNGLPADFEEMTIGTIHSFCNKILTDYAFENHLPMQREIQGDTSNLIRQAVLNVLRGNDFLDGEGSLMVESQLKNDLTSFIDNLVAQVKDHKDDVPPPVENPILYENLCQAGRAVADRLAGRDLYQWAFEPYQNYINGNGKKGAENFYRDISVLFNELCNKNFTNCQIEFGILIQKISNANNQPTPQILKNAQANVNNATRLLAIDELAPWAELVEKSRFFHETTTSILSNQAYEEWQRLKAQQCTLSFDDMIQETRATIAREAAKENSPFLASIRKRYRIAMVDEFQDTDPAQWEIFQTLFSKANNPDGFLLVVGDPKQAIYSFRGADINTYNKAKGIIMPNMPGEQPFVLNQTFRSSEELIGEFNTLFGDDWFTNNDNIDYTPVAYPQGNEKFKDIKDKYGALCLLESAPAADIAASNRDRCLPVFAKHAVTEIQRLMGDEKAVIRVKNENGDYVIRHLQYRDFCFLVKAKADAKPIRRALNKAHIPFSFHKEPGIFDSTESESLLALFDFLADRKPGNLAAVLLTPFFHITPAGLAAATENPDPNVNDLFDKWGEYVCKRKWSLLFESFMNDTLLATPQENECEFDRLRAGTRQILDRLLGELGSSAMGIQEFAARLRQIRNQEKAASENAKPRAISSEKDRVGIITMHSSKGLEYPVVFVPYGWGSPRAGEKPDELRRLLYVALTRAEYRLYLPWSKDAGENGFGSKNAALLANEFLYNAIKRVLAQKGLSDQEAVNPANWATAFYGDATVEEMRRAAENAVSTAIPVPEEAPGIQIAGATRLRWDSASSLKHHVTVPKKSLEPPRRDPNDEVESDDKQKKPSTLLPYGNISGNVFHCIMETLCNNPDLENKPGFCKVGQAASWEDLVNENSPFLEIVRNAMRDNGLQNNQQDGDSTEKLLARIIWKTLRTQIAIGKHTFRLCEIPATDRRAEVKFVLNENTALELNQETNDCFNGSIDLIVRPKGKEGPFFILDWKTNYLSEYSEGTLAKAMIESGYDIQYKLYSLAASKWLTGKNTLGGIGFVFVRAAEKGDAPAIFAKDAENGFLEDASQTIKKAIHQ